MPATLRDVAEHAGVSVRTVSNVVAGYEHVSTAMRERVQRAIQELDYRPNPVARTLRTGRTGLLALVVPEIDVPYFADLARQVIEAAAAQGYRVMLEQTGHDHARERAVLTGDERTMLFDGVLFAPLVTPAELAEMTPGPGLPLVLLGEYTFDGRFDHVAIDNVQAAHDATAHLASLGRRRIAAIGSQPAEEYATPRQRTLGYEQALLEADLPVDPALRRPAPRYRRSEGYRAALDLLRQPTPPDAIFCFSDLLAMGAMRAAVDAGLRVPDDVAIVGIDDIEEGRYSSPSLTSVSLDTPFIAAAAVERIVTRIAEPDTPPIEVVAPHELIVRESTVGPGAHVARPA